MKSYTELNVWIYSRRLVRDVCKLTKSFPKEEVYNLTNQIRRSVVSVPSSVGRQSDKETTHFLYIVKGSLFELETQLYLSFDLEYISKEKLKEIQEQLSICEKLLNGFINYFKNKL